MIENDYGIPSEVCLRFLIAQNLTRLRKKYEITQEALAEITGIHRVTIANYERCRNSISLNNLLIIAKALGETPNTILEGWESLL